MIERLYIKDVAKQLDLKKYRTVYRWCKNNGVGIFSDIGSKNKFVIKAEFEAAKIKEMLKYLTKKYKNVNLNQFLNADISFYLQINSDNKQQRNSHSNVQKNNIEYTPKGESEKSFLNDLLNI